VKDLRESMNIDKKYYDSLIAAKFGRTDDLVERTGQHVKTYGIIKGAYLKLKYQRNTDIMDIL